MRRGERERMIRGTEHEALEFARRACEYLRPSGVESVEAWSCGPIEGEPENFPGLLRFCLKPHRNGRDWIAEPNELHHGGWWSELRQALDYALYRGNGRICAVEILGPRIKANQRELRIQRCFLTSAFSIQHLAFPWVVLVDRTGTDACPTQGRSACQRVRSWGRDEREGADREPGGQWGIRLR